jgi:protein-S-isoprenylcysteine O-methyltransferase Ste14
LALNSCPSRRAIATTKGEGHIVELLFLATIAIAPADAGRFALSDNVPAALSLIALIVFAAAMSFVAWAVIVNPFFSSAVRIQSERGHHLITSGQHRWLRHPGYLVMIVAVLASALAIGSWLALVPGVAFCLVIVWRARREDIFLMEHLPGYPAYSERVRGGLLPRFGNSNTALRKGQN